MQLIWLMPSLAFSLYLGFSSGMWQMTIMSAMTAGVAIVVAIVRRRQPDLAARPVFSIRGSRAYLGDKSLPRNQWFWQKKWHSYIYEQLRHEVSPFTLERWRTERERAGFGIDTDDTARIRMSLGLGRQSELRPDLISQGPHLLIIGPTGSGKSECFKLILNSLLNSHDERKLQFFLIDYKGGATFAPFAHAPAAIGLATDLDVTDASSAGDCWIFIEGELERRERLFADARTANFETYVSTGGQAEPLARLIIAVDELTAAYQSSNRAARALEALATRGRSLGVHLIGANQTLVGLPRIMLTNFRMRVALGGVDAIELTQLGAKAQQISQAEIDQRRWRAALFIEQGISEQQFLLPIGCRFEPAAEPAAA